jgi:serine/threonine protein kinase
MVGSRIGKYRLVRQLGEGGMGVVYEAVREDIAARAAIKVLRREYTSNPELAGRFFNEARAANLIPHPGIVRIFDYGTEPDGLAYLAMEFLDGESLWKRMERNRRMPLPEALRIGRQMASALAAAHEKQIVHRDLKPDNIFLVPDSEAPGGERIKLLDFGIAKMADEYRGAVRTQLNYIMGTPAYMSPEQCRGSKGIGAPVDVYSLGVILFEMLAGRAPFVAAEPGDYLAMHMLQPPPRLSDFVPNLPVPLIEIVLRMLAKEPSERPTMAQVADMLRRLLWAGPDSFGQDGRVIDPAFFAESSRFMGDTGRVPIESGRYRLEPAKMSGEVAASGPNPHAQTVSAPESLGEPSPSQGLSVKPGRLQALVAEVIAQPAEQAAPIEKVAESSDSDSSAQRLAEAATLIRTPGGSIKNAAHSSQIWEPMEIIKTDYQSSPGMAVKQPALLALQQAENPERTALLPEKPEKRVAPVVREKPPAPRGEFWWWALLALAIVLSILLARVLPR